MPPQWRKKKTSPLVSVFVPDGRRAEAGDREKLVERVGLLLMLRDQGREEVVGGVESVGHGRLRM
jgi:hypothetical protein